MDPRPGLKLLSWSEDPATLAWKEKAYCRGMAIDIFFGGDYTEARKACAQCPVIDECREYNRAFEEAIGWRSGFYAGTTAQERDGKRKLRSATRYVQD